MLAAKTILTLALAASALAFRSAAQPADKETFEQFKAGAEKGDAAAEYKLAVCLANGDGAPKNPVEAFRWCAPPDTREPARGLPPVS